MKTIVYWSMKTSNCIICIVVLFLSFSFGCGSEEVFNEIGNHKDGEKHGKWISYFEDGQIWHEGNYKDGKEHGEFIYFGYGNYNILHKVKSEGYKDGKLNGKIIHFHVNGEKNSIVNYSLFREYSQVPRYLRVFFSAETFVSIICEFRKNAFVPYDSPGAVRSRSSPRHTYLRRV